MLRWFFHMEVTRAVSLRKCFCSFCFLGYFCFMGCLDHYCLGDFVYSESVLLFEEIHSDFLQYFWCNFWLV